jgi:hypothetical protein
MNCLVKREIIHRSYCCHILEIIGQKLSGAFGNLVLWVCDVARAFKYVPSCWVLDISELFSRLP